MDEKMKIEEIEEKWEKEFKSDWDIHKQEAEQFLGKILDVKTIEALCRIYYFQACRKRQEEGQAILSECERLKDFIKENYPSDHFDLVERVKELEEQNEKLRMVDTRHGVELVDRLGRAENKVKELEDLLVRKVCGSIICHAEKIQKDKELIELRELIEKGKEEGFWIECINQHKTEIVTLETKIKKLEGELNNIDELLSRRYALDIEPTRCNKIMKAIDTARNADSAIIKIKELEEEIVDLKISRDFWKESYKKEKP